jgi:hypothetical protein
MLDDKICGMKSLRHVEYLTFLCMESLWAGKRAKIYERKEIRKVGAMIHIKMNFKTFLLPLLRIISLPYNFSTFFLPFFPSDRPFGIAMNKGTINFNSQKNVSQSEVKRTAKKNNLTLQQKSRYENHTTSDSDSKVHWYESLFLFFQNKCRPSLLAILSEAQYFDTNT